ncbi:MAG: efflux RND transporter permease subunit [Planctomycetota bacterium]|nr:efflux RND transporter permease subunit [Planctomycetota bacterium]
MKKHPRDFFHLIVSRPIGTMVILVSLTVLGLISYFGLPVQLIPGGIEGSRFSVFVNHPGSSANENESKVAAVLEEEFRTLPDVEDMWSRSDDDSVRVRVQFKGDGNLELARAELRDRIERARPRLPDTVTRIGVWANDDGEPPIMVFILMVDENEANPSFLIEQHVQRRIEAIEGVSKVDIWGMLDEAIRILLDETKVRAANMDIGALIQRMSRDNFSKPLGEIKSGHKELLLRSDMRFDDLQEIRDYPIGNGQTINDVGIVMRTKSVRDWLSRVDGRRAYYGMVQRESNANVVNTARGVAELLEELNNDPKLNGRIKIATLFDQGEVIEASLSRLQSTALWGGGLAIIVLLLFLRRLRTTLVVAMSIPVSVLLALVYEYFTGGSFNILTMTGLTLALGMLVDNSVVVIENISRMRNEGMGRKESSAHGAREVGLAISLATITTLVVFLPLVFTIKDPMMAVFIQAMTRPLSLALLFSLMVALFFLPVLAYLMGAPRPDWVKGPFALLGKLSALPVRGLAYCIGAVLFAWQVLIWFMHRVSTPLVRLFTPLRLMLVVALGLLIGRSWYVGRETFQWNQQLQAMGLSNPPDSSPVIYGVLFVVGTVLLLFALPVLRKQPSAVRGFEFRVPQGDSPLAWIQSANHRLLEWTLHHRMLACILSVLVLFTISFPIGKLEMASFGQDEDSSELIMRVRLEDNFTLAQASREMRKYEQYFEKRREELGFEHVSARFRSTRGRIGLHFAQGTSSKDKMEALRHRLQREVPRFPGHSLRFGDEQALGDANNQQVQFLLRGSHSEELERLGAEAVEILRGVSGLTDVESPLESAPEQVRLILDREAAFEFGTTSQSTLENVSWALRGAQLARYQEEGREIPLLIEYDQEKIAGLDTLRNLNVWNGEGAVALASYGKLDFQPGSREIWRSNGQTTFSINARLTDANSKVQIQQAGYDALEGLNMPKGYSLGRDVSAFAERNEQNNQMLIAAIMSMLLVTLVMAVLFESVILPAAVMTTVPFAVVGALWSLYFFNPTFDSMGWIGFILLVGVVVNNGIVLLDKIHRLHTEDGLNRHDAVLEGARARVRPILMTAMTTVFGLLPITLSAYDGKGLDYRVLATLVAGGLAFSTFFTLWVVPLAYTLLEDFRMFLVRTLRLGFLGGRNADAPSGAATPQPLTVQQADKS